METGLSGQAVLDDVVIKARDFYYSKLGSPWSICAPSIPFSTFHVILRGRGVTRLTESGLELPLQGGGLVLLPWGDEHIIGDSLTIPPEPLTKYLERTLPPGGSLVRVSQGSSPEITLICGVFELEGLAHHPVYRHLPRMLYVPSDGDRPLPWLGLFLDQIEREIRQKSSGYRSVLSKLFDLIFYEVLRYWMENQALQQGWMTALRDPFLGKAMNAVHRTPEQEWTVARLGQIAGMSRSSFSARFHELVGVSPMSYVSEWKLWRAYQLLKSSDLGVSQVASKVGFSCENALARAFRRHYGLSPSELRKQVASANS